MNNGYFIKEIKIENFRGYEQQEFNFFNQKEDLGGLILLGGPNGYGKTSLLDSIEWCMTGTIQRIVEDYEIRKEKNKKMQKGLLRHNGSKEYVSVIMDIKYLNNDIRIERIFTGENESDGFFPENSTFKVDGVIMQEVQTIDFVLNQSISKDFYERYTSSYEKNIRVYEKSRNDIYNMFSSFFGGTKEIEEIINNLDGFPGKTKRRGLIDELNIQILEEFKPKFVRAKGIYDDAEKRQTELLEERKSSGDVSIHIQDYPKEKLFNQEIFPQDLVSDDYNNINRIKNQISMLKELKFLKEKKAAYGQVISYLKQLHNQKKLQFFYKQIETPFNQLIEDVLNVQGKERENIEQNKNKQEGYKKEIYHYKKPSKEGVNKLKAIYSSISDENDKEFSVFSKIDEYYLNIEKLKNQLEGFKSSDIAINALRSLIDHSQGFHKLRENDQQECPLCGSKELFPIQSNELVVNARTILGEVDSKRANLQKLHNDQEEQINVTYSQFVNHLLTLIDTKIISLDTILASFDKTKIFKNACASFEINFNEINMNIIQIKKRELEEKVLDKLEINKLEQSLLNLLKNNQDELDSIPSLFTNAFMKLNEFISIDIEDKLEILSNFKDLYNKKKEQLPEVNIDEIKIEVIIKKISILEKVEYDLNNDKDMKESQSELDKKTQILKQHEELLKKKQGELGELKKISQELKKIRKQWDRQMVEEIRSPLQQIYRRINRHSNIEEINLIMDGTTNTKASLMASISNGEVSATNILSAGQLSVVALSIFLTVAMGQKSNVFKCYFMDDPIQTMDDLNILSFIDLLRSELSLEQEENRLIDQLFYTTCDENLENLMIHKMKNFGVNYTHIHFTGYGEYEQRP